MARNRKKLTRIPFTERKRGAVVTDPVGDHYVAPYPEGGLTGPGGGVLVLGADGQWTEVVSISGGGAATWGSITGTLSDQTDLQTALDAKQDKLVWDEELGNYLIAR